MLAVGTVTEVEARELLRAYDGAGDRAAWIAAQPWRQITGGWLVEGQMRGERFVLETRPDHLRVTALAQGGGEPTVWTVERAR
jgi:hypothetical protein